MSDVWFITGASRGLGTEITKAALARGYQVVATGRDATSVERVFGRSEAVLALPLDVTVPEQAEAAAKSAIERFGRIDVLVNNAGYAILGALEELSLAEISEQFATNVFGLASVTRAVLPYMRKQRSGHIFNISSSAGIRGAAGASAYCATKFAVEGLSESLAQEVSDFGIRVTIVEPGPFRTQFFSSGSIKSAATVIDDYQRGPVGALRDQSPKAHGQQPGDPVKLADALITLAQYDAPPLRLVAGTDAVRVMQQTLDARRRELDEHMALSVAMMISE